MTPERLQEIRVRLNDDGIVDELLDYIDLLHEDLRITREERDKAKKDALAYRRGQGPAPTPATPGTVALHETHTIPNSRGDDQ